MAVSKEKQSLWEAECEEKMWETESVLAKATESVLAKATASQQPLCRDSTCNTCLLCVMLVMMVMTIQNG